LSAAPYRFARLGVLGGMGPLATIDFLKKLVAATPAERDQDHIPVVVYSVPQVPDRVGPILRNEGESPLPAMTEGVRTLEAAGAGCIVIPCITAHHWYDALCQATTIPIIHIADATCAALKEQGIRGNVGLLATTATLHSGFFQRRLETAGWRPVLPTAEVMRELVLPSIACVKRYDMATARRLASEAVTDLLTCDLQAVVLACSELPAALEGAASSLTARCVDTLAALAQACVAWHRTSHAQA
jgi:aspartate racemase